MTRTKKRLRERPAPRKRARKKKEPHVYVQPKTAAELGITCSALVNGEKCGKAVLWFDYAFGEKDYMRGFVCDAHKVSNRVEKLAVKETAKVAV